MGNKRAQNARTRHHTHHPRHVNHGQHSPVQINSNRRSINPIDWHWIGADGCDVPVVVLTLSDSYDDMDKLN